MSDGLAANSSLHFYKVYHLDSLGDIKASTLLNARDDADALQMADEIAVSGEIEVWDQTRFVGRVGLKVPEPFQTGSHDSGRFGKTA